MPKQPTRPRKAVSFTQFRRIQLGALQSLMSSQTSRSLPIDTQLQCFAMLDALQEARFKDACDLAKAITQQQYGDAETFRLVQQLANLVRKVPYQGEDFDPRGKAIEAFLDAEEECRAANTALRPYVALMEGRGAGTITPEGTRCSGTAEVSEEGARISRLLMRARVHIRRVLGEKPPLREIAENCRFSGGSVQGCTGSSTHLAAKILAKEWTVTPGCLPYASSFMMGNPYIWEGLFGFPHNHAGPEEFRVAFMSKVRLVEHDQIDFVPKTAEVHRTIGKQASLNAYVQNGVGDWLRDKLREVANIDIRTAQDRVNGPLARLGSSCEGHPFATLDLKAASDTIAIQFVKLLLPPEWFSFLDAIRSPGYTLDGVNNRYAKFVAMGNGFCFPLETLLFWSLVQAVYDLNVIPDRTCAVYGDDIIVYQCVALELTELLNVCGFTLNSEKSFVFGPFRESCGQDFFGGVNVRPFVLDEIVEDYGHLYHMINSLSSRGFTAVSRDLHQFVPQRHFFVRRVPGPSNTAIEVPDDVFLTSAHVRWNKDLHAFESKALITVPVFDDSSYDMGRVGMYSALSGLTATEQGDPAFALRFRTKTFTRWEAGDGVRAFVPHKHWEMPERRLQRTRTFALFATLRAAAQAV